MSEPKSAYGSFAAKGSFEPLTPLPPIPVHVLQQSTGVGKSRMYRNTAVRTQNNTKYEGVVVISVDRHDLGQEQLDDFHKEHPDTALVPRIWRGRGADDPEQPGKLMCWRNDEAEEVNGHGLSVENSLCRQLVDGEEVLCPFFVLCGYQRQKQAGHIWFVAHQMLGRGVPKVFGEVLRVLVDEDPLDAFFFGIDRGYTVPLDVLTERPRIKDEEVCEKLMQARLKLHAVLVTLPEGPVPLPALAYFPEAMEMSRLEWKAKVDVEIRPDWGWARVKAALAQAAHNKTVIKLTDLWWLIAKTDELSPGIMRQRIGATSPERRFSGWIDIIRDGGVRYLRMKGVKGPKQGWQRHTVIASATLDPELMKKVWVPKEEHDGWRYDGGKWDFNELPKAIVARPKHVTVRQTIDASFSKTWCLPDEPEKFVERTRDILAMVLREAVQLAPLHSLMVCHLATQALIAPKSITTEIPALVQAAQALPDFRNFHVPPWLQLAHHGAITGLNKWSTVRAQFVVGRAMPSAELITLQAEAMCGEYISQRNYIQREVPIYTVPDADGKHFIYVNQFEHPHPLAQRLLRRVVWGGVMQEIGRTRFISRKRDEPLDIWLLNDVPMDTSFGPVIPVQLDNVEDDLPCIAPTLDDLMLTTGCWLENTADAKRAHDTIIASAEALKKARSRDNSAAPYLKLIAGGSVEGAFQVVLYRRDVPKTKKAHAIFLTGLTDDPKAWLEERLGKLAEYETL